MTITKNFRLPLAITLLAALALAGCAGNDELCDNDIIRNSLQVQFEAMGFEDVDIDDLEYVGDASDGFVCGCELYLEHERSDDRLVVDQDFQFTVRMVDGYPVMDADRGELNIEVKSLGFFKSLLQLIGGLILLGIIIFFAFIN
jgi:hypothetical protein